MNKYQLILLPPGNWSSVFLVSLSLFQVFTFCISSSLLIIWAWRLHRISWNSSSLFSVSLSLFQAFAYCISLSLLVIRAWRLQRKCILNALSKPLGANLGTPLADKGESKQDLIIPSSWNYIPSSWTSLKLDFKQKLWWQKKVKENKI